MSIYITKSNDVPAGKGGGADYGAAPNVSPQELFADPWADGESSEDIIERQWANAAQLARNVPVTRTQVAKGLAFVSIPFYAYVALGGHKMPLWARALAAAYALGQLGVQLGRDDGTGPYGALR